MCVRDREGSTDVSTPEDERKGGENGGWLALVNPARLGWCGKMGLLDWLIGAEINAERLPGWLDRSVERRFGENDVRKN